MPIIPIYIRAPSVALSPTDDIDVVDSYVAGADASDDYLAGADAAGEFVAGADTAEDFLA